MKRAHRLGRRNENQSRPQTMIFIDLQRQRVNFIEMQTAEGNRHIHNQKLFRRHDGNKEALKRRKEINREKGLFSVIKYDRLITREFKDKQNI